MKKAFAILLSALLICAAFAGCSSNKSEKYSSETLIIGYTEAVEPFLSVDENGKATGFDAELMKLIFDDVKGDLKNYRFEKVEEGYMLEDDGGFFDSEGNEYSAALLMGGAAKNEGTFNEDYSFTEPIITNRVIAVTAKGSERTGFTDFSEAKVVVSSDNAMKAFKANKTIYSACKSLSETDDINVALKMLDEGVADILVTDEFCFNKCDKAGDYAVMEKELDTIEYVIACAKYSGWKDSLNEAIKELKDENYDDGDAFTPLVEKYFGYNASSFEYETND
ncbi:MAG: transporter substrate-binding domain-containing protein [Ruminococcaceae bacterium]|nr:transporter substrate-binding domain-containing protein [Oscillospiraceae bacterium]